ncbi:MAG TPA: DNA-binding transcriptional regulator [Marinobacter sp.]|nr:DNA-binding transcriptional regulator [Marinobacter sp.]
MEPSVTASYKTVRGLSRGLTVLNALNRELVGATPSRLSEITGIHRTTVRRLLETLQSDGYVRRSPSDDSYRLTIKVRELSEGFRDDHWISSVAAPLLGELLNEVVWPTDLTTLDMDAMVVRETTHRFSRLSFHRSMVGRRLPILETASGLAYIAYCPDNEREQLIELLARRQGREGEIARDEKALTNLLLRTRRKGFGENFQDWDAEHRIASIAVPIIWQEEVLACLNLVYIAEAMTIDEAAEKYLPALLRTRDRIVKALRPSEDEAESSF